MLKDKRIDELRRLLKRYKKIEEMVVQAQGRKGEYCICPSFHFFRISVSSYMNKIRMLGVYILPVFMMSQEGEIAVMFFHFYSDCVSYSDHFSQLKELISNCIRTWFWQNFLSHSALLVHSSLFLLSSSLDFLVGSYWLYVFLWKREVTTQVMSVHGESENHPGFVLVLEFCQIIGIPKTICLEILASKCTCNVCKIDKIGALFMCICHLINVLVDFSDAYCPE